MQVSLCIGTQYLLTGIPIWNRLALLVMFYRREELPMVRQLEPFGHFVINLSAGLGGFLRFSRHLFTVIGELSRWVQL
jgi:hypothetical protein